MIEKNIKTMIPLAMEIIEKSEIYIAGKGVENIYHGYISSFLPSVSQSTLLKVLEFYELKDKNNKRNKIIPILFDILAHEKIKLVDSGSRNKSLLEITTQCKNDAVSYRNWKNRIAEAAIACKFAMRTFQVIKKEEMERP
ncbi:MAG: hypothetical protein MUO31_11830 [Thermodesulfovibrionales bacterium]|nr:hypothetical protein [Thermodesulfovibrionales bacterium]